MNFQTPAGSIKSDLWVAVVFLVAPVAGMIPVSVPRSIKCVTIVSSTMKTQTLLKCRVMTMTNKCPAA